MAPPAHHRALPWVHATAVAVTVATAFLPWVRTGQASRSSYRLLRDLTNLGLLDSGAATAGRVVWVLLPALAALTVLLLGLGRHRLGGTVGVVVSLIGIGGAITVVRSPVASLIGTWSMLALAPVALLLSLVNLVIGGSRAPDATPSPVVTTPQ